MDANVIAVGHVHGRMRALVELGDDPVGGAALGRLEGSPT